MAIHTLLRALIPCLLILSLHLVGMSTVLAKTTATRAIDEILLMLTGSAADQQRALKFVHDHWQTEWIPMILETAQLTRSARYTIQLIRLLEQKTGQSFAFDIQRWYEWLWNQPALEHPLYPEFKSRLYRMIDLKFADYFSVGRLSTIRLDEVRWGGVRQDGIPPLRYPKMIPAAEADYLAADHIIFGIAINGDVRAYPKRILAWHEMFIDTVGGVPIAGVYCTLCGTVIPFKTVHNGVQHQLGTSGFLYRSNKLMYDQSTQSLWNTLWGTPVIGPLVGQDIRLQRLSIVTTTWGEWRRRHPKTAVLSLDTGYQRDYSEGAAYRDYFAIDDLMFNVPKLDRRLKNKDEVLALVFSAYPDQPLAISADYLTRHPLYHDRIEDLQFVVLTDTSGANRVYQSGTIKFASWDGDNAIKDDQSQYWTLSEDALLGPNSQRLHRLPAHRAFWFGWYAAYPHTRLVH